MIGNKAEILGVKIDSSSKEEVLKTIVEIASRAVDGKCEVGSEKLEMKLEMRNTEKSHISHQYPASHFSLLTSKYKPLTVFTPNPEFIVEASKDNGFRELLNKADINLPDGIGLVWASRLLGEPIKERISGADAVEKLLDYGNEAGSEKWEAGNEVRSGKLEREVGNGKGWTIGVAGARRGVQSEADELVKRLQEKYPNINFVNIDIKSKVRNHFGKLGILGKSEKSGSQTARKSELSDYSGSLIIRDTEFSECSENKTTIFNIIFAAHGMKKQEQWIMENKNKLNASVFMGVGGSLDFIAGFTKRAPLIMRQAGMEWLWRGLQKPKHFLRIWQAVFVFNWLLFKEIIRNR